MTVVLAVLGGSFDGTFGGSFGGATKHASDDGFGDGPPNHAHLALRPSLSEKFDILHAM